MSMGTASVTVAADVSQFQSGMAQAGSAATQLQTAIAQLAGAFAQMNAANAASVAALNQMGAALNNAGAAATNVGTAITSGGSGGGLMAVFSGFGDSIQSAGENVSGMAGGLMGLLNPLDLVQTHMGRLLEVMAGWRIMEYGIAKIRDFANELMSLPVTMQQTEMAWTYTYGMGQTVNPTGDLATAKGIGQQLAAWSAQYSYNIPYTRQNEMQAITNLAMTNLTPLGIQQYLPVVADLAASAGNGFGGQPVDLSRASYAIQGALMGYNRMLQYDLHIRPEQLAQYGYDANNPSTLMPALQQFGLATGRIQYAWVDPKTGQPMVNTDVNSPNFGNATVAGKVNPNNYSAQQWSDLLTSGKIQDVGAAYVMAHTTWSGAYSSFQDRWQNLALDISGFPAYNSPDGTKAGAMRPGSPIAMAMQGLNALTAWWDEPTHKAMFEEIGSALSKTLGQAMSDAGQGIEAFAKAVSDTGIGGSIANAFQNLSRALSDPAFQRGLTTVAGLVGNTLGNAGKNLGTGLGALGHGAGDFWSSLGPQGQRQAIGLLGLPGTAWGVLATLFGGGLSASGDFIHGMQSGSFQGFMGGYGQALNAFGGGAVSSFDLLMNWMANPGGYKPGNAQNWWQNTASPWLGGLGAFLGFGGPRPLHGAQADYMGRTPTLWSGIGGWLNQGDQNFGQWAGGGVKGIEQWWSGLTSSVGKSFSDLGTTISGKFQSALQTAHTWVSNITNAFQSLVTWVQNFASALSKIPGFSLIFGGGSSRLSSTPGRNAASGTIPGSTS